MQEQEFYFKSDENNIADRMSGLVQESGPQDPVWINSNLVGIDEFVTSAEHLGKTTIQLSDIQRRDLVAFLGEDPKKVFSRGSQYLIAVYMWGKGSGKDWLCAIIVCYCLYILLNMRNPQAFFGLDPVEPINLVNVSGSGSKDSAVEVFFGKLSENIKNWKWLAQRYTIYEQGRMAKLIHNQPNLPRLDIMSDGKIRIHDKRINALAYGSNADSIEGGNVLLWLMDEASAFKDKTELNNARKIYSVMRTSATSRFGMRWKGLVISYPRADDDFTVKMYEESEQGKKEKEARRQALTNPDSVANTETTQETINIYGDTIYGSKHATWEVLPEWKFCGQKFEFEGMQIPIEFKDDFDKYPEESKAKFACIPPAVEDAFMKYKDRIFQCIVPGRAPLFTTLDTEIQHIISGDGEEEKKKYIGKFVNWIREKSVATLKTKRVIHVDGGLVEDSAAMILAHGEPHEVKMYNKDGQMVSTFVNKVIVDAIVVWKPDKSKGLQVSLNNIESLILELKKWLNIVKISYDQWNSQTSLETLQSHGMKAEMHTINNEDYYQLKTMVYNGAVELLPISYRVGADEFLNKEAELLIWELQKLKLFHGKKVDHPVGGSKETTDCLAGVNRLLNEPEEKKETVNTMPKAITGLGMTRATPSPFSPAAYGIMQELPSMPGMPKTKTPQTGVTPGLEVGWVKEHNRPQVSEQKAPGKFPKGLLSGGRPSVPNQGPGGQGGNQAPPYMR